MCAIKGEELLFKQRKMKYVVGFELFPFVGFIELLVEFLNKLQQKRHILQAW